MTKTVTVRARMEAKLKTKVEDIFQKLGLSTTEAINLFYKQVELQQGLPCNWGFNSDILIILAIN
ncbi:MAG: type II toxin-antitoxin system RelB/DinJ family antitoxin [Cyanobacterium sp.]